MTGGGGRVRFRRNSHGASGTGKPEHRVSGILHPFQRHLRRDSGMVGSGGDGGALRRGKRRLLDPRQDPAHAEVAGRISARRRQRLAALLRAGERRLGTDARDRSQQVQRRAVWPVHAAHGPDGRAGEALARRHDRDAPADRERGDEPLLRSAAILLHVASGQHGFDDGGHLLQLQRHRHGAHRGELQRRARNHDERTWARTESRSA
jgi:hypothetical protein